MHGGGQIQVGYWDEEIMKCLFVCLDPHYLTERDRLFGVLSPAQTLTHKTY